ncbi:hypothetical protein EX30DRAFT_76046 [Ascodesmis nigricans]|uniref:Uncharacterized protein n=1 Tax=Ascodesmis nigricans TaxID=341454 RepID=A0A4S2MTH9_9PEZI|nr:hypothetical protein EX30DRAFT_76046 [Ascodesmis nigricans]
MLRIWPILNTFLVLGDGGVKWWFGVHRRTVDIDGGMERAVEGRGGGGGEIGRRKKEKEAALTPPRRRAIMLLVRWADRAIYRSARFFFGCFLLRMRISIPCLCGVPTRPRGLVRFLRPASFVFFRQASSDGGQRYVTREPGLFCRPGGRAAMAIDTGVVLRPRRAAAPAVGINRIPI